MLEFENIMVRFDVHVYVVPYVYCYECYEDVWINMRRNDISFWDYEIVIEIKYKWEVEHELICEIHINTWWQIMTLWDVKIVDMEFGCE